MSYLVMGPLRIRTSTKYLSKIGLPALSIGGLSIWQRDSGGRFMPFAYHPRGSLTWHWTATIIPVVSRKRAWSHTWAHITPESFRRGQWYDYFWLPFGYELMICRQDWHKGPK